MILTGLPAVVASCLWGGRTGTLQSSRLRVMVVVATMTKEDS